MHLGVIYCIDKKQSGVQILRTLEINKNDAGQRLDKFLQKRFKTLPKSLMYKYIRKSALKSTVKNVRFKQCLMRAMC